MTSRTFLVALALGVGAAELSLAAFGYLVAFHPFGREAERSAWLVPLLQVMSWLPFAAIASFTLVRFSSVNLAGAALVAALSSVATVISESLLHAPTLSFWDTISAIWLHVLCPLAFFPLLAYLLANGSFQRSAYGAR